MTTQYAPSLIAIQVAACLGFLVVQLDVSVVNVALGALKSAFDTNLTGLQWVINSYALVFSALLILGGGLCSGALILVGIGSAVLVPSITNSMLAAVSKHDAGMASGLMASARQMGGVIGIALFGALIASADTALFMHGMSNAMLVSFVSLLASILIILKLRPVIKPQQQS